MKAIIKTGGKQYIVENGTEIYIEKLDSEVGSKVVFDEVLMHGETVGTPNIKDAKDTGEIVRHGKQKKIVIFKFKAKKDYRNKTGHRQPYTLVKITDLGK